MKYTITGKNLAITDNLREAIYDKFDKLDKYFSPDTNIYVTLSVEKQRQKVEATVPIKGHTIRAEQSSDDMYVSIDLVEEILVRQLRKYKTKITDREQGSGSFKQEYLDKDFMDEEDIKIILKTVWVVLAGRGAE